MSLYGTESSLLDSLGLVSFLFILEEVIEQETGRKIKFSAEDIMSPAINPFSSIKEMVSWLAKMLNESSIA